MSEVGKKREMQYLEAYEAYTDALFRFCYFKVSDREVARDIVQDAFMKVWEYVSAGTPIDDIRPLLYRIAHNEVIDYYRKKKAIPLDELVHDCADDRADASSLAKDREVMETLQKSLIGIDPLYQEVILMRYIEEMSVSEIANILGISQNVVSVRLHRGKKLLRDNFKTYPLHGTA